MSVLGDPGMDDPLVTLMERLRRSAAGLELAETMVVPPRFSANFARCSATPARTAESTGHTHTYTHSLARSLSCLSLDGGDATAGRRAGA
jgi:hypothetical protein